MKVSRSAADRGAQKAEGCWTQGELTTVPALLMPLGVFFHFPGKYLKFDL